MAAVKGYSAALTLSVVTRTQPGFIFQYALTDMLKTSLYNSTSFIFLGKKGIQVLCSLVYVDTITCHGVLVHSPFFIAVL